MKPHWLLIWQALFMAQLYQVCQCNQSRKFDLNFPRHKSPSSYSSTTLITRLKCKNDTWSNGRFNLDNLIQRRVKRANRRNKACEMLIAIDEPLYRMYDGKMDNLTELAKDYVKELNNIYQRTIFYDGGPFQYLYFRIKEIRVLFDFCVECNETQRVYLNQFTKMDTSHFCLAHVFTYRDFPAGVQGLAWKGTMCRKRHNTGFSTFLNHQVRSTREESIMTFAHEVGHNVGAQHDQDVGCEGGYIMSESGSKRNFSEHQFSPCSLYNMTNELNTAIEHYPHCFVNKDETDKDDFSFCGNYMIEGEEECDCGLSYLHCSDPCCYAAQIDPNDLAGNHSATPCRTNNKRICQHPYESIWKYGLVAPWITILVVAAVSAAYLLYDWKHQRKYFGHVTQPKELIRSETTEQMKQRMKRQQSSENNKLIEGNVYVLNVGAPLPQQTQPLRGVPIRKSGKRPISPPPSIPYHPTAPPPPPIPPPPTAPPPPPPKDYPPTAPFVGKPPTSQSVSRLKSQFENRH